MTAAAGNAHALHLGIAEAGKLHALAHRHAEALRHYREALRRAVAARAPEVFFRHYTQCVLESLEQMGSYDEVIEFCERADAHYRAHGHHMALQRRDHAAILERLGAVRAKAGRPGPAAEALRAAIALVPPGTLPLAEELLGWLDRRLTPDPARIAVAQTRRGYFTVTRAQVDPRRARPLPGDHAPQSAGAPPPFG